MDAWEDNTKRPGEIFLFGKTPVYNKARIEFHSICVIVENVDRCLYVLPKSEISLNEAMAEFSNYVHTDLNISSCRSKVVEKLFCFNTDEVKAPKKTNYLMARYPGKSPLPHPNKKFKHIQHIFGTSASSIENFLLETSIKGPSWIEINNYNECNSEISWCKQQISCTNVSSIKLINDQKSPPPSLVVCCVNIKSMVNPDNMKTELVMISMMINNNYDLNKPIKAGGAGLYNRYMCGVTRPTTTLWPKQLPPELLGAARGGEIVKSENERALLSWFLANIKNIDPDLLLTYDADDCQLNVLQNKLFELKIPHWSRIGRLRMQVPTTKRYDDTIVGRLICDIKTSAEELVKLRSFDLETLVVNILKVSGIL
jgi:DNA polymerase alpha subunit A